MEANYEIIDQRPMLRFERRLAHPVAAVWRAITEPAELAKWFPCEVELELRVEAEMRFVFAENPLPDGPLTMRGKVTELDPPRRFSFTWGEDHLHFALEPSDDDAACLLRFTVELDSVEKAARDGAGWHVCLDGLEQRLAGTDRPRPYGKEGWRELYEMYRSRGFPATAPLPSESGDTQGS